jgi:hypothetical protein
VISASGYHQSLPLRLVLVGQNFIDADATQLREAVPECLE